MPYFSAEERKKLEEADGALNDFVQPGGKRTAGEKNEVLRKLIAVRDMLKMPHGV